MRLQVHFAELKLLVCDCVIRGKNMHGIPLYLYVSAISSKAKWNFIIVYSVIVGYIH